MFSQQTVREMRDISHCLKTLTIQLWAFPWLMVLLLAALLSLVGVLAGLPGNEIGSRFIREAADPVALLQFKILSVVYFFNGLWLLIGPASLVMLALHWTVSIRPNRLRLIVLWQPLTEQARLLLCQASLPILWRIHSAGMVNPQSRFIAGLSPQLE